MFPLETLVPVAVGSALFHAFISFLVLLAGVLFIKGAIPLTVLWLPVVIAPFVLMLLGIGWFLAALGVYLRDIGQLTGTVTTALLFLAPIFYPPAAIPEWVAPYINFQSDCNPDRDVARCGRFWGCAKPLLLLCYIPWSPLSSPHWVWHFSIRRERALPMSSSDTRKLNR